MEVEGFGDDRVFLQKEFLFLAPGAGDARFHRRRQDHHLFGPGEFVDRHRHPFVDDRKERREGGHGQQPGQQEQPRPGRQAKVAEERLVGMPPGAQIQEFVFEVVVFAHPIPRDSSESANFTISGRHNR